MNKKKCLLLVCTGNTDRSPIAAAIAKHWSPGLDVISRGIYAPEGEPMSGIAQKALEVGGIPVLQHSSAPLIATDVIKADLILAMTHEQKQYIAREFPQAKAKTFLLRENGDISDPTLWNLQVYEQLRNDIASALRPWLLKLEKKGH